MTRALVTQLLEVLESTTYNGPKMGRAIKSAREYLATEPSGERAELANEIRSTANHLSRYDTPGFPMNPFAAVCHKAADMLEADAREAKRVPISDGVIAVITDACFQAVADQGTTVLMRAVARAIEAHHGITPADKPTGWDNGLSQDYCAEFGQWLASRPGARQQIKAMFDEPEEEDLYALALKADNWGQP